MKKIKEEYMSCPIRRVLSEFCDKWSLLVLYSLYCSDNGVMRFSELHRFMSDCSQKMLSTTLKKLERHNLVSRKVYAMVPPKVEYSLTPDGESLMPKVIDLVAWAQEHFDDVAT